MITGQEELTRWNTHAIANGTAMFFGVSLGFLLLVQYIASKVEDHAGRRALQVFSYIGCFSLMAIMSIATPFGL